MAAETADWNESINDAPDATTHFFSLNHSGDYAVLLFEMPLMVSYKNILIVIENNC